MGRGDTKGGRGVRRGKKRDWIWLTVLSMTPYSVIVTCMKKSISSPKHLATDVVFQNFAEIVEY